ncbi:MAG TPA: carboxypeptidase-like regulatory domain-containing protein [Bacteroidia bacterium]|nr:carboxypeptidase-like regulatory domain-containing protein [Bacteroidia bacterium]
MNKKQEDTFNMYEAVNDVLQKHSSVWSANIPFSDAVTELENSIEEIGNLRNRQEENVRGIAEDKKRKRKALTQQTYTISSALVFYASSTGNTELLSKVKFSRRKLAKARDNGLIGMSKQVHQAAEDNAAAILPYGITGAHIAALAAAIETFAEYISKPKAALGETIAATKQLAEQFNTTDTLLEEQLDQGMELYSATAGKFYREHFIARIIINSPKLKRALEATFVDDATGEALANVQVAIGKKIRRRSSKRGSIRVQNLKEGTHKLKASLEGYADTLKSFTTVRGKTTKLVVRMRRG